MRPNLPSAERGSVLIMAILIVALVAGLSVRFAREYQLGLARAETRWYGAQALAYLSGAERLAVYFLEQDDPEIDSHVEMWAQDIPPFPVEGGHLVAQIEDATARFNLNTLGAALTNEDSPNKPERFTAPFQRRFIRLLLSSPDLQLSEEEAISTLEAIVDWMDADSTITGFNGAEEDYYQSLEPPYNPANKPFRSVEELQMVRYITPELMQFLTPFITVLPMVASTPATGNGPVGNGQTGSANGNGQTGEASGNAPTGNGQTGGANITASSETMNVNTMAPELLRTLNAADNLAPLTESELESVLAEAAVEYTALSEFTENPAWDNILPEGAALNTEGLAVTTNFFVIKTYVNLGEQRRGREILLMREGETFKTLLRRDIY